MNTVAPSGALLADQIAELTRGLAQIDRTRGDHILELGRKLIPIRQLLQAANGTHSFPAADGLHPKGWIAWCRSAGIPHTTAGLAISRAVDPEGNREKMRKKNTHGNTLPSTVLRQLRRAWPNWTSDQQQDFIDAVTSIAENSNG